MKIESLTQVISQRRSIYPPAYNDEPIDDETIKAVLENANWAPNHKKTEPWRWKVIRKDGLSRLSKYLGEYYKANTAPEKYSDMKYKRTVTKPLKSQAVIAICMYNDPDINIPEWEEIAAVAMAVQNMWLSCTALGIGAYWSSPRSAMEADGFLQLAPNEKCLGWFYMGYSDIPPPNATRTATEGKTTWINT